MSKILLFIPCYRCETQIQRVLEKIALSKISVDILVIDNKSPDETVKNAIEAVDRYGIKNTTIIQNQENINLGGSHKVAFKYALSSDYTHLIVIHGDDQADIRDLISFIRDGSYLNYDCLLGSRFHRSSKLHGYSFIRKLGNIVLNAFCSLVCKKSISDMGSGLNMYSRNFFQDQRYAHFPDDLTFNVWLLFHSYMTNFKIMFFPISWREEDQVSNAKVLRQFKNIMKSILGILNEPSAIYQGSVSDKLFKVIYRN